MMRNTFYILRKRGGKHFLNYNNQRRKFSYKYVNFFYKCELPYQSLNC